LGGDAFLVTHHSATKSNLAFNGSGEGSHAATPENYQGGIPLHGYKSGTVPGLVSTWFEAHKRYGKLPFAQLLAQAIDYAENGFPANAGFVNRIKAHLAATPDTRVFVDMISLFKKIWLVRLRKSRPVVALLSMKVESPRNLLRVRLAGLTLKI
jgi:gamma-glutamyltranspeptidase/glutathione hydrolase